MIKKTDEKTSGKNHQGTDTAMLNNLQKDTFDYFLHEIDSVTGLISDKTKGGSPASIGVMGMGISAYIVGVEKGFMPHSTAVNRLLKLLRFFYNDPQLEKNDATGHKGFYYHFLDMHTGKRAWKSELSTIDTAFFIAGILTAAAYFSGQNKEETEIRQLADELYRRVDWQWALDGGDSITHGWMPESGFLPYRWDQNYSEAIILYILALGSPTYPIKPTGYQKWIDTFELKEIYDTKYLYSGPLFIHQFSHMWIDFRGIHDEFNIKAGFDYFENSKRATQVHQKYAIENPKKFTGYGKNNWGFTASDGPGFISRELFGIKRNFYGYMARGAPFGPDDGTISPWAVVASLPFAPEIVLETIRHAIEMFDLDVKHKYGFDASFNPTFPKKKGQRNGWVSPWKFGLNQGPVVIMIENYQTGLIWKMMSKCSYIINGLRSAGFSGGWMDKIPRDT